MRRIYSVAQLYGVAFLCMSVVLTGSASRREELERAAELAVERAAERVAERAVEKALETGNSSSETETIRVSHSSERKFDSTHRLPGFVYTPRARKEHERIMKEKKAGELAVAEIMRGQRYRRAIVDNNNKYNSQIEQNNNNIYLHGANTQTSNSPRNLYDIPKTSLTMAEVNSFYPYFSYQKIPIEHTALFLHEDNRNTFPAHLPVNAILYHPISLFRVNQPISSIRYYHHPSASQPIRPLHYYPSEIKILKNTNDQTSTY